MSTEKGFRLAILYDESSRYSPSNPEAISLFMRNAEKLGIEAAIINKNDMDRLNSFDGLFVRDTTNYGEYTFEFIVAAENLGLKVIDNSTSVMQGCNKIWQMNQFNECKIPYPRSSLLYRNNPIFFDEYPSIIKVPDSTFSQGVFKVDDKSQAARIMNQISSPISICQEFIQTKFDWRIGIFNHKFLFAVKYYIADDDFRVIKYDRQGNFSKAKHQCVSFEDIPPVVLATAFKCDQLLTDGLYGIDIKEFGDKAYVIEINDNPNIDAGIEDDIEGERIYETIMKWYLE